VASGKIHQYSRRRCSRSICRRVPQAHMLQGQREGKLHQALRDLVKELTSHIDTFGSDRAGTSTTVPAGLTARQDIGNPVLPENTLSQQPPNTACSRSLPTRAETGTFGRNIFWPWVLELVDLLGTDSHDYTKSRRPRRNKPTTVLLRQSII
jgi:hypothetical protein